MTEETYTLPLDKMAEIIGKTMALRSAIIGRQHHRELKEAVDEILYLMRPQRRRPERRP
jgi:hypothetical protein